MVSHNRATLDARVLSDFAARHLTVNPRDLHSVRMEMEAAGKAPYPRQNQFGARGAPDWLLQAPFEQNADESRILGRAARSRKHDRPPSMPQ